MVHNLLNLSGIYAFECSPTGKLYVGSAKRLRIRRKKHLDLLRGGRHPNIHFQRAWQKHGGSAFQFRVLLVCAVADLIFYEQRALDVLMPELNILRTARSSLGRKYTPEGYERIVVGNRKRASDLTWRANMSARCMGRIITPEQKAKISAALRGRTRPTEVCLKIREGWARRPKSLVPKRSAPVGRKGSPEVCAKISAALKGRKKSLETRAKMSAAHLGVRKTAKNVNQLTMEI